MEYLSFFCCLMVSYHILITGSVIWSRSGRGCPQDDAGVYRAFLVLLVGLSLGANPIAQNEVRKMLEAFSGTVQVRELDEEEKEEDLLR